MGMLNHLRVLNLSYNSITGAYCCTLPCKVHQPTYPAATCLLLRRGVHHIVGRIPTEIGHLTQLTDLSLRRNALDGWYFTHAAAK